jgi:DNA-binding winged helix-turn-helix (wHTH) protein
MPRPGRVARLCVAKSSAIKANDKLFTPLLHRAYRAVKCHFYRARMSREHLGEAVAITPRDLAVLEVLVSRTGTVVSRDTIRRLADLRQFSQRRCDSAIVAIRRILGNDAVITVRGRGWMLQPECETAARTLLKTSR